MDDLTMDDLPWHCGRFFNVVLQENRFGKARLRVIGILLRKFGVFSRRIESVRNIRRISAQNYD